MVSGDELVYACESGTLSETYPDWLDIAIERSVDRPPLNWLIGEDAELFYVLSIEDPAAREEPDTYLVLRWNATSDDQTTQCVFLQR